MNVDAPFAAKLAAVPVEKREISVLGSTTRYWLYGDADARVTLVLAHGYRGDHHGLEALIAELPHLRFISPDLPGFGESTPMRGTPHSIDGYSEWLRAFVDEVAPYGDAVILGHSFGSIVASAAFARGMTAPGLILVNPISVSGLDGPRPWVTRLTVWYYHLARRLPESLGNALLKSWFIVQFMSISLVKTRDKALRTWIHSEHHTYFSNYANRDVVVEAFDASISANVSDFADRITARTLLVAAELDDITPVSAHAPVAKAIGDAELVVIPRVGHLIHYETPKQAATAIDRFVAALPLS